MLSILTTEFKYEAKFIPNPLPHTHTHTENTFPVTHLLWKCLPLSHPLAFQPTTQRKMTMSFRFRRIKIHYVDTHLYVRHFGHMLHLCNKCLSTPTIHSVGHDIQTEGYKHTIRRQVILSLSHITLPRSLEIVLWCKIWDFHGYELWCTGISVFETKTYGFIRYKPKYIRLMRYKASRFLNHASWIYCRTSRKVTAITIIWLMFQIWVLNTAQPSSISCNLRLFDSLRR